MTKNTQESGFEKEGERTPEKAKAQTKKMKSTPEKAKAQTQK